MLDKLILVFQPGNKLGRGRPKKRPQKPESLSAVLYRENVNWAADIGRLCRQLKTRTFTPEEKVLWDYYREMMPYLCVKADRSNTGEPPQAEDKVEKARETSALLKALEQENVVRPQTQG